MKFYRITGILFIVALIGGKVVAQISPGDLANVHSHLEGVTNCTQCHILGEKVSNDKCLSCHTELKERTSQNKGYHSSTEVKGKECAACHSDHHGLTFQIVKFDETKFRHTLTGFELTETHAKKKCSDCHIPKYITNPKIKTKKFTYLGLNTRCISCHDDYHQKTLAEDCSKCHDTKAFKPATKFNHNTAKYDLTGAHKNVECNKCHKTDTKNGKKFQEFTGLKFANCTNCHADVHNNKFGQNCLQCHTKESFVISEGIKNFDHAKTDYTLEQKHLGVNCKSCHKINFTTPLKHEKCADCHKDYHDNQFAKEGIKPDCSGCHNLSGFVNFSYSIEQHNKSVFPIQGSHTATPCFSCHKKTEKWAFREIGKRCADCHSNIHKDFISDKYYPEQSCQSCHSESQWSEVRFDHSKTNFKLTGAHEAQGCRKCHFTEKPDGTFQQQFAGLSVNCSTCHTDNHFRQFEKEGVTDCLSCHETVNWKAVKFNHNNTTFKLEGSHANVLCARCHKPADVNQNKNIQYKISAKCESCHS